MAAVEIDRDAMFSPDFESLRIEAATYAVFEHRGSAATLRDTVMAVWDRGLVRRTDSCPRPRRISNSTLPIMIRWTRWGAVEIWVPLDPHTSANDDVRRLFLRPDT